MHVGGGTLALRGPGRWSKFGQPDPRAPPSARAPKLISSSTLLCLPLAPVPSEVRIVTASQRTVGDPAGDLEVSVFLRGLGALTGILGFQVNPGPFPAVTGECLASPSLPSFCLAFFLRFPFWEEGWCLVPFGKIIS